MENHVLSELYSTEEATHITMQIHPHIKCTHMYQLYMYIIHIILYIHICIYHLTKKKKKKTQRLSNSRRRFRSYSVLTGAMA